MNLSLIIGAHNSTRPSSHTRSYGMLGCGNLTMFGPFIVLSHLYGLYDEVRACGLEDQAHVIRKLEFNATQLTTHNNINGPEQGR